MEVDISALDASIGSLNSSLDILGRWLTAWIVFVVVGLIVECITVALELLNKEPATRKRKALLVLAGPILITVGVSGELVNHIHESAIETELKVKNDLKVAVFNLKASEANERALKAEGQIEGLKTAAKGFESAIANANARAEADRLARVKIEQQLAWRTLTAEQQGRIVAKMKRFAGQQYVLSVSPEPEAIRFMGVLDTVLQAAGWVRLPATGNVTIEDRLATVALKSGVHAQVAPSRESTLGAVVLMLRDALQSEGIEASADRNAEIEPTPNLIAIIVGSKPQ